MTRTKHLVKVSEAIQNIPLCANKNYRNGIGAVIINECGKIAMFKRIVDGGWQFPEGGIETGEEPLAALKRELYEETGIQNYQLKKEGSSYCYKIPQGMIPETLKAKNIIGQNKKWFLILINHNEFNLNITNKPEFIDFCFLAPQECIRNVVRFKRNIYTSVLKEFDLLN